MHTSAEIRRSGNVLEVEPACLDVLAPVLQYQHRLLDYSPWNRRKRFSDLSAGSGMTVQTRELYRCADGKLYTLQGALSRIQSALSAAGIAHTYSDLRVKKTLMPDYEYLALNMPNLQFRLKQDEVLATLIGKDNGVIVAPTAYGKTFIMMALAAVYPKATIIMASPSTALLSGAYRRMLSVTPDVGRVGGGFNEPRRVTLSTYASLMKAPVDRCDILLIDEAHRASSPEFSDNLSKIRSPVKIFGMTATPHGRSDGSELAIEVMIGPVVYRIAYEEAADSGSIAKIRYALVPLSSLECSIDSARYHTKIAKLRWCYWRNEARNRKLASAVLNYPSRMGVRDNPQTLVLAATVEHAFRLAKFLPGFTVVYASLSKAQLSKFASQGLIEPGYIPLTSSRRETLLRDFEAGKLRSVIATGCWGEGVDFIHLDVVVNASGAPSPITAVQWGGRGSRLYDGKEFGLLIDVADDWDPWTSGRAKRRVTEYRRNKWTYVKPSAEHG